MGLLDKLIEGARREHRDGSDGEDTFLLFRDEDGEDAAWGIIEYFKDEPGRSAVRLVVDDEEVGTLTREAVLLANIDVKPRFKAMGVGRGDHARLGGTPQAAAFVTLRCTVESCGETARCTAGSASHERTCSRGHRMKRDEAKESG